MLALEQALIRKGDAVVLQLFLKKHFGIVVFIVVAMGVLPSQTQTMQNPANPLSVDSTEMSLHREVGRIEDPLLVAAAHKSGRFEVCVGEWEFPGLQWSLATQETNTAPIVPEDLLSADAYSTFTAESDAGTDMDQELLVLFQSLMAPTSQSDSVVHYQHDAPGLRGHAVSYRHGDQEIPVWASLQWPATDGRWTEVTLTRTLAKHDFDPILTLPVGSTVVSQRRNVAGQIQCQAVEVTMDPQTLMQYLSDQGWQIRRDSAVPHCFWVQSASGLFEFTWHNAEEHRCGYLIRPL